MRLRFRLFFVVVWRSCGNILAGCSKHHNSSGGQLACHRVLYCGRALIGSNAVCVDASTSNQACWVVSRLSYSCSSTQVYWIFSCRENLNVDIFLGGGDFPVQILLVLYGCVHVCMCVCRRFHRLGFFVSVYSALPV